MNCEEVFWKEKGKEKYFFQMITVHFSAAFACGQSVKKKKKNHVFWRNEININEMVLKMDKICLKWVADCTHLHADNTAIFLWQAIVTCVVIISVITNLFTLSYWILTKGFFLLVQ